MKRTKFIALALVVAVMLMGAAYAAWTDRLDVNTTIGTGELSVRFLGPHQTGQDEYWASPRMFYLDLVGHEGDGIWNWASATTNDLFTADVDYSDKVMTFTFGNMYPGTRAAGKYTIENNGTIPAVIDNVDVTVTTLDSHDGISEVADAIRVNSSRVNLVRDGTVIDFKDINNVSLAHLPGVLEGFFEGKRLQPTDKVVLSGDNAIGDESINTFNFELPYNSLFYDQGELETIKIKIRFDFVQHNMYVAPTPAPTPGA